MDRLGENVEESLLLDNELLLTDEERTELDKRLLEYEEKPTEGIEWVKLKEGLENKT